MPLEAESVQITAVGRAGRNLLASTSVPLLAPSGPMRVGPLLLAQGGTCSPSWLPTFGGQPGTDGADQRPDGVRRRRRAGALRRRQLHDRGRRGGERHREVGRLELGGARQRDERRDLVIYALTVFDDGSGPALYAGGSFTTAGGVAANRIAKWDGSSWAALGSGVNERLVNALTVFDDGGGPALYAGGCFTTAGGVAANRIAKWDGSSWAALGSGMNGVVNALTVFDDGGGPALYAGGNFTTAGGVAANNDREVGRLELDGARQRDEQSDVDALTVFDDGGGPALYAGGNFTTAGGVAANRDREVGRLELGGPRQRDERRLRRPALTVFDDGGGPALYAGGVFTSAGGVAANRIAKWDGSSWAALGSGMNGWHRSVP